MHDFLLSCEFVLSKSFFPQADILLNSWEKPAFLLSPAAGAASKRRQQAAYSVVWASRRLWCGCLARPTSLTERAVLPAEVRCVRSPLSGVSRYRIESRKRKMEARKSKNSKNRKSKFQKSKMEKRKSSGSYSCSSLVTVLPRSSIFHF